MRGYSGKEKRGEKGQCLLTTLSPTNDTQRFLRSIPAPMVKYLWSV
jgi:hypothetical protein